MDFEQLAKTENESECVNRILEKLDILNRDEFVDQLVKLTENISANKASTTFAINGSWGCGKSFVLDMYETRLNPTQSEETALDKYFIIRYNCWKYDYYEEPLVAIVAAMIDIINQKTKLWNDEKKKAHVLGVLKSVGATLLSMVNSSIKDKTGVDLQAACKTVSGGIANGEDAFQKTHEYDIYFSFNQALKRLQQLLADICEDQTVIFMVDELDRCLPEYAIKVLERLHHLTEDSHNVITVIAIDKVQLEESIKQIFGFKDVKKYLEKFINFEVPLDNGVVSERIVEKYAEYFGLFDSELMKYDDSIEEFVQSVFRGIEARQQEELIQRASLVHRLLFSEAKDLSFMCVELLMVILTYRYKAIKKFTSWLNAFNSIHEVTKEAPPFDSYFEEKFNNMPVSTTIRETTRGAKTIYYVKPETTLYCAIAYIWCNLFFAGSNRASIVIEDMETRSLLDKNIEDLKKFSQMIRLIN